MVILPCTSILPSLQFSGENCKQQQQHIPLQPLQCPPMDSALPTQLALPADQTPTSKNMLRLDDEDELMSGDEELDDTYNDERPRPIGLDSHQPSHSQQLIGSNAHHIQLMKASFFGKVDTQPSPSKATFPFTTSHLQDCITSANDVSMRHKASFSLASRSLQASAHHSASFSSGAHFPALPQQGGTTCNLPMPQLKQSTDSLHPKEHQPPLPSTPHLTPSSTSLLAQSAVLMSKHDLRVLIPARDCACAGHQRCLCDHGLFLGRSFRVGWGPNWTMVHSGEKLSSPSSPNLVGLGGHDGLLFARKMAGHEGHPIRVVVEHLGFNTVSADCGPVSACLCSQTR